MKLQLEVSYQGPAENAETRLEDLHTTTAVVDASSFFTAVKQIKTEGFALGAKTAIPWHQIITIELSQ